MVSSCQHRQHQTQTANVRTVNSAHTRINTDDDATDGGINYADVDTRALVNLQLSGNLMFDPSPSAISTGPTALPANAIAGRKLNATLIFVTLVAALTLAGAVAYFFGYRPSWGNAAPPIATPVEGVQSAPRAAEDAKLLLERAALAPGRVLVIDIGRVVAAWSAQPSTSTEQGQSATVAMMGRIKNIMRIYSDAGYTAIESRYLLTYPSEADQTAVVATVLNVNLAELTAQGVTPYMAGQSAATASPIPNGAASTSAPSPSPSPSPTGTNATATSAPTSPPLPTVKENPKDD